MKNVKRLLSVLLVFAMIFSICTDAFAAGKSGIKKTLCVNFGDSIADGIIENAADFPKYDRSKHSYSALFAQYLGTTRVSYARRGMQTTDVLYMLDKDYQADVDKRLVTPDSWHQREYPPYDGTSLKTVRSTTAKADYITLCVGVCDYFSYPNDVCTGALSETADPDEITKKLNEYRDAGIIDTGTLAALAELLETYGERSQIILNFVFSILNGYSDYLENYPKIVRSLRALNSEGTIILVGNYLPSDMASVLVETPQSGVLLRFCNRLLDNINYIAKGSALKYGCVYIDTMGIESKWHPTVDGHRQLYGRIISVLGGSAQYTGSIPVASEIMERFRVDARAAAKPIPFIISKEFRKLFTLMESVTVSSLYPAFLRGAEVFC